MHAEFDYYVHQEERKKSEFKFWRYISSVSSVEVR